MLETSELSLEDYCFSSQTRNSDGPGKYRHVVDAMRTSAWFHVLRMRIRATSTRHMEKVLEPGAFGVDDSGTAYNHNKWRGYRLGRHTPRPELVQAVERLHPGALRVFDHVIWDTLRPDCTLSRHQLLNRLGPSASKILANPRLQKKDGTLRGDLVERVERFADLDGFACLVTLLRQRINAKSDASMEYLSLALCRSAIAASPLLYSLGIAGPLADYINGQFLCRAITNGHVHDLNAHHYLKRAKLAAKLVYFAERNENCRFTYPEKVDFILDVLRGLYGDRLALEMMPTRYAVPLLVKSWSLLANDRC